MRARRVLITHAVNDGDVALLVHVSYCAHLRVQADLVVKVQHLLLRNADRRAVVVVDFVVVRDYRIQVVIAAGKLHNHHDRVFLRCGHLYIPLSLSLVCLSMCIFLCVLVVPERDDEL